MKVNDEIKARAVNAVERSGKKLEQLRVEIGTSYSTLWNFLYGKTQNFGKLQELAASCGVSVDWLLTGENQDQSDGLAPTKSRRREFIDALIAGTKQGLTPEEATLKMARDTLKTLLDKPKDEQLTVDQLAATARAILEAGQKN